MFLEKVKQVKKAEENAAEKRARGIDLQSGEFHEHI